MNSISVLGKYLDQPRLVGKFSNAVPAILVGGGAAYSLNHIRKTPQENRKKEAVKTTIIMSATVASALVAPQGAEKIATKIGTIFKKTSQKAIEAAEKEFEYGDMTIKQIEEHHTKIIDKFKEDYPKLHSSVKEILDKAKKQILSVKEIKTLFSKLENNKEANEFLNGERGLIPNPENIDSAKIFEEIGRLSILGAIPVAGGIAGGIVADKVTEKDWKQRIPNKIKEGAYQYLANIFLCNVGAGGALWLMEKKNITSKPARAAGMIAGILAVGVIGGSAIANFIGKTCIDPFLGAKNKQKDLRQDGQDNLYSERKPEMLDIGLHTDDIATVAVLSGLKWIEPALPILYSISGYRAGIGYRNGDAGCQN